MAIVLLDEYEVETYPFFSFLFFRMARGVCLLVAP